ncbi:hypothetical protein [Brevundimonas faecalis]|uniref:Uncharacterized protein n=1 Tax=Brevundimonas faecalis TaxID=947378 RepID=A0ABV2R734_9CAUL
MIAVLGAAVLLLGGASLFAATQGARFGPRQATAGERALAQVKAQMGPRGELRYVEAGRGRAVCGYAGVRGEKGATAFVSRPNRILMSHDPLSGEFVELKARYCPGFDAAAPEAAAPTAPTPSAAQVAAPAP